MKTFMFLTSSPFFSRYSLYSWDHKIIFTTLYSIFSSKFSHKDFLIPSDILCKYHHVPLYSLHDLFNRVTFKLYSQSPKVPSCLCKIHYKEPKAAGVGKHRPSPEHIYHYVSQLSRFWVKICLIKKTFNFLKSLKNF